MAEKFNFAIDWTSFFTVYVPDFGAEINISVRWPGVKVMESIFVGFVSLELSEATCQISVPGIEIVWY
jgi:hypothetical protein